MPRCLNKELFFKTVSETLFLLFKNQMFFIIQLYLCGVALNWTAAFLNVRWGCAGCWPPNGTSHDDHDLVAWWPQFAVVVIDCDHPELFDFKREWFSGFPFQIFPFCSVSQVPRWAFSELSVNDLCQCGISAFAVVEDELLLPKMSEDVWFTTFSKIYFVENFFRDCCWLIWSLGSELIEIYSPSEIISSWIIALMNDGSKEQCWNFK